MNRFRPNAQTRSILHRASLVAMALVLLGAIWFVPMWRVEAVKEASHKAIQSAEVGPSTLPSAEPSTVDYLQQEIALRAVLAQIVAGMLLAFGAWVSWRQFVNSREGQITDRFTKAISQLGSEQLEIRLGGIYALERIARDSLADHWNVMEVLTTYVRENSPWPPKDGAAIAFSEYQPASEQNLEAGQADDGQDETPQHRPKADIQAIMTVIGRRSASQRRYEREQGYELDLRGVDLRGADLNEAHLEHARLWKVNLEHADLVGTNLEHADLHEANMWHARLWKARLERASLWGANLKHTFLKDAHLEHAFLLGANLEHAFLLGANLERTNLWGANLEGTMMQHTRHLTMKQLKWAHYNKKTSFPVNIALSRLQKTNVWQRAARGEIKPDDDDAHLLVVGDSLISLDSTAEVEANEDAPPEDTPDATL
jgi:uncharacterized protein YjbI with pentapeptide repeats